MRMRGAADRVDDNQSEIVDTLRKCGCMVQILSSVGRGVPDLLVGVPRGWLILIEVKDGSKPPSRQRLSEDEEKFHRNWRRYPLFICKSVQDAITAIDHECTSFDVHRDGRKTCSGCKRELLA